MEENKPENKPESMNIDGLLRVVGEFGRFQWMLDAVFCMLIIPETFQTLIMYFAALKPDWRCTHNSTLCTYNETFTSDNEFRCNLPRNDWEFTEPVEYSIVTQFDIYCKDEWIIYMATSILFIGWAFGAVFLGWVADNYGRKIVIFPSVAMLLVVGFITPFIPNLTAVIICRFIVGFFSPGTSVQQFILMSEFVGTKYRPKAGIIIWFFFTVALCILGLKAYFIRQWKILYIVCTAPYIIMLLFYKFVPESVRWLRLQGRIDEAMIIFQRIAEWNKNKLSPGITIEPVSEMSKSHKSSPRELFKDKKTAIKSLIQGYAWMVNGMIYYGLSLAADDLGGSLYLNYILVSFVEFPAVIMAIDFCERFGRKKTVSYSMLIAGITCIVVGFIPGTGGSKYARVVLGMMGKLLVSISFNAIYTWSVEIYPTGIRAVGMGYLQVTSRIGAASSPWVAKGLKVIHSTVPFIVMGVLGVISSVLTMFLPETRGKETAEMEDKADNRIMDNVVGNENISTL